MKHLIFLVLFVLTAIAANLSWIWPVVEFCLYLFKNDPFNWVSVWTCLGLYTALLLSFVGYSYTKLK
jgi:hypothetical protein